MRGVGDAIGRFRPSLEEVYVFKTSASQATTSNVAANVTGFAWSVVASGVYVIEIQGLYLSSAATTTGGVYSFTGPAAPTSVFYTGDFPTSGTARISLSANAFAGTMTVPDVPSTTVYHPFQIWMALENGSTAGTVQLQFATEVNTSNHTFGRGSWGRATRVG